MTFKFFLIGILLIMSYNDAAGQKTSRPFASNHSDTTSPYYKVSDENLIKIMARPFKSSDLNNNQTKSNQCGQYIVTTADLQKTAKTGDFMVSYTGFSAEARAAFQHAVDIWSRFLTTNIPISINARFSPLPTGVLGSAGPTYVSLNFPNAPQTDTWFPIALADQLTGQDNLGADIVANFSSSFNSWYFGLDGCPPPGQYDFVTVVIHEIAHGLGFFASASAFYYPFPPVGLYGCYGFDLNSQYYPMIYDTYLESDTGVKLIDFDPYYCWGELYTMFTDNKLVLNAPLLSDCMGTNAKVYAPAFFSEGSSISHFDENTYTTGSDQALMTPFISSGEAIHLPGCAVNLLADFGYDAHELESNDITAIPTLGQWGLIFLITILMTLAVSVIRSQQLNAESSN